MIRTVLFDLDDTLLWDKKSIATAFEKTCQVAAKSTGVDPARLEQSVRQAARDLYSSHSTYDFTQQIGINPFEGLWGTFDDPGEMFQLMKEWIPTYQKEAWSRGLLMEGVEDIELGGQLAERFREERIRSPFVYEETFAVLEELKGLYELVLITNGSPSLQQQKLAITKEISPYFDLIVISGAVGKGKPNRAIFQFALEQIGRSPSECIMVGDNHMTDILGAGGIGMKSVWINREEKAPHPDIHATYEIDHLTQLLPILEELKNA
ncbi:HAD family hydrolase [Sporosarcina sp. Te-1]|uniref:HAD family hydrolase n=1 Tax=Sporosarcina sp. Te-1 TaxID=2818390 RepID=UPI001A9FF40D|nr:HAD family hydrolase [Sporosarcina sp. Te-1]QTD41277.1 HAD family hydrolase [Sporosarcina sp. Te-1]